MAKLDILEFPDPRLRIHAKDVTCFDATLRQLADDMLETMYAAPGIGLAAVQVNVPLRILVLDVSEEQNSPQVFINPHVSILSEDLQSYEEGCLSVPGFHEKVERPARIHVKAFDVDGKAFEQVAEGLLAVCLQHEIDHLDGKLFVDYISRLKRDRIRKKLEKIHQQQA